jgi:hypothetical protein
MTPNKYTYKVKLKWGYNKKNTCKTFLQVFN